MQGNPLNSILQLLTGSGPMILLCVLGIIFALVQREKAPKAAIFVIISLVVMVLLMIVRPIGYNLLGRMNGDAKGTLFQIWGFVCYLVDMAATAGLIFAAFCDRVVPLGPITPYGQQFGGVPPSGNPYIAPNPLPPLGGPMRPPQ